MFWAPAPDVFLTAPKAMRTAQGHNKAFLLGMILFAKGRGCYALQRGFEKHFTPAKVKTGLFFPDVRRDTQPPRVGADNALPQGSPYGTKLCELCETL